MTPLTKRLLIVLFPISLLIPSASLLLPVTPSEIDNRRLVAPEFSFEVLFDPLFYKEWLAYVRDANPVRELLIKVGVGLDYHLLNESPNPGEVLLGDEGWLYRRRTFDNLCDQSVVNVVSQLEALVTEIESHGGLVVYTVVPHKFAITPEFLKSDQLVLASCGMEGDKRLRAELAATAHPGYVDSWVLFESLKENGTEPFFRTDTHFNYRGSIPWMQALLTKIEPGLWDPDAVIDQGSVDFEGNLAKIIVPGVTEKTSKSIIDRGLNREPAEQLHDRISLTETATESYRADAVGVPLIEGETVMLRDSFMNLPAPSFAQYFRDISFMDWRSDDSVSYFLQRARHAEVTLIEIAAEAIFPRLTDDTLVHAFRGSAEGP